MVFYYTVELKELRTCTYMTVKNITQILILFKKWIWFNYKIMKWQIGPFNFCHFTSDQYVSPQHSPTVRLMFLIVHAPHKLTSAILMMVYVYTDWVRKKFTISFKFRTQCLFSFFFQKIQNPIILQSFKKVYKVLLVPNIISQYSLILFLKILTLPNKKKMNLYSSFELK